jgi:hypothetical protein
MFAVVAQIPPFPPAYEMPEFQVPPPPPPGVGAPNEQVTLALVAGIPELVPGLVENGVPPRIILTLL